MGMRTRKRAVKFMGYKRVGFGITTGSIGSQVKAVSTNQKGKFHVHRLDRCTLGVNGRRLDIVEKSDDIFLGNFLQRQQCIAGETAACTLFTRTSLTVLDCWKFMGSRDSRCMNKRSPSLGARMGASGSEGRSMSGSVEFP